MSSIRSRSQLLAIYYKTHEINQHRRKIAIIRVDGDTTKFEKSKYKHMTNYLRYVHGIWIN